MRMTITIMTTTTKLPKSNTDHQALTTGSWYRHHHHHQELASVRANLQAIPSGTLAVKTPGRLWMLQVMMFTGLQWLYYYLVPGPRL